MTCMVNRLKRASGTFDNFLKNFGVSLSPKHRQSNSYRLFRHWNLKNFWEFLLRRTEKYVSLRSILHTKWSCSRMYFKQCRPSILKWSYGINLVKFFKFIIGQFPSYFFSTRKRLLRTFPFVGTNFWIAPFSNICKTYCSTTENFSFDIFIKFGIFSWNRWLTNGISYPFIKDNISWSWIIFPSLLWSKVVLSLMVHLECLL